MFDRGRILKLCCAIEHMLILPNGSTSIGDFDTMKGGFDNRR